MRTIMGLLSLCVLTTLTACGPSVKEQCAQAKNPTECAQVASAGGDVSDYLVYGMAGYMLSSAINGSGQRQSVIVADPSYHGYRRPIASYQSSRNHVRRSGTTTTTTTRRTMFGGTKTTTVTSRWSSRPSRSSFRSGRR